MNTKQMLSAELLKKGDVDASQAQLFNEIRQDPTNVNLRVFLFQLCCVQQNWTRAKTQIKVLTELSPDSLTMVQTYSQLIDCELMRESVFDGKRTPSCFGEPVEWLAYFHQAFCLSQLQEFTNAKLASIEGANLATPVSGNIDGNPFNWITDGDMRFGPAFEVMLNGAYHYLPFEYIKSIDFEPVEDLRDMVWRPAHLTLKNNGKLIVFVPTRYPLNDGSLAPHKLAQTCDWKEPVPEFYIGQGQRILITDDQEVGLLDITRIEFD